MYYAWDKQRTLDAEHAKAIAGTREKQSGELATARTDAAKARVAVRPGIRG